MITLLGIVDQANLKLLRRKRRNVFAGFWPKLGSQMVFVLTGKGEGFRSIINQKNSYGCEQESQDLI
jgi:hypothetical protein